MIWAWCTLAAAETPLTIDDALAAAEQTNPSWVRARLETDRTDAGVVASWGGFDPQLELNGNWRSSQNRGFFQGFPFTSKSRSFDLGASVSHTLSTGTSYSVGTSLDRNFSSFITDFGGTDAEQIQDTYTSNANISVTQQLLKGFRTRYNLQNVTRARQDVDRAELSLQKARQDALSQTATAYWGWVYQEQLAEIGRTSVEVAEEALRVGKLQLEAGRIAPVEGTRLEAALVQAQATALDAEISSQKASADLALLMGVEPMAWIPAQPETEAMLEDLEMAAAVDVALAQNLDVLTARAEREFAEADQWNAKHNRLPTLSATGSAGVSAQSTEGAGRSITGLFEEQAFPFVAVGARFAVPLGNRSARGALEQANVRVRSQTLTVAELEKSVSASVRNQVRQLGASAKRIELADANARLAEQTLSAEEALASAGRSVQKTVLEARAEVRRTAAEAARARADHRLARTELLRLQGLL